MSGEQAGASAVINNSCPPVTCDVMSSDFCSCQRQRWVNAHIPNLLYQKHSKIDRDFFGFYLRTKGKPDRLCTLQSGIIEETSIGTKTQMTSMLNVCLFKSHYKIPMSRYSLNMDCLIDLLWINSTMKLKLSGVLAPIVCCHRRTIESGLGSCVTEGLQMHTAADAHRECSYEDDRCLTPSLLDICNIHLTPKSTRHHC